MVEHSPQDDNASPSQMDAWVGVDSLQAEKNHTHSDVIVCWQNDKYFNKRAALRN